MKFRAVLGVIAMTVSAVVVQAQMPVDGTHYPAGLEGIKGAATPAPGFAFRDDNLFYYGTVDNLCLFAGTKSKLDQRVETTGGHLWHGVDGAFSLQGHQL
jgi:hypothetical protein